MHNPHHQAGRRAQSWQQRQRITPTRNEKERTKPPSFEHNMNIRKRQRTYALDLLALEGKMACHLVSLRHAQKINNCKGFSILALSCYNLIDHYHTPDSGEGHC